MASTAHLKGEEKLGLGVAVVAHVALFAALLWHANREPAEIPPAERMSVSLAEEVSLESTAPDPSEAAPAAVAPVLAPEPEPAPVPEPVVERRPQPAERTVARPTPRPSPTARRPEARETSRPAGGSRLGDDFLRGVSDGDRSDARGTPAATFGAAEQAALSQAINRQLKPHWSAPSGVDAEKLVTVLAWELNPDGSLAGRPRVVSQTGITDSNRPQAALHAERAVRAVQLAAPFDLPEQFYDKWRRIREWRFDRRL